ncbi:UNVERIFIED_CONTAM: hypothetical protein GTU68_063755 [Idotea baltica]|nr:hypothetical protein [Idotea baltica]
MKTNQSGIDFGDGKACKQDFLLFENIITDRGSKYSVAGGRVKNREDIRAFLKKLKQNKKYAKATHNTYAARVTKDNQVWDTKSDDGETGAGNVILRVMQKENITDTVIVVTRWFGGIKLMQDRFKHVQDATKYFFKKI